MQFHAGIIEEARLAQKPDGIARGNPAGGEVLGIAVAGEHVAALREGLIHRGDEVRIDDIIRVEDEERVVIGQGTVHADAADQLVERVALADLMGIEPLEHGRARLTRGAGGARPCCYRQARRYPAARRDNPARGDWQPARR